MKNVVILGAGPAGLAAAYELSRKGNVAEVIEKNNDVGGLSRTSELKGCKFDLGPHIFIKRNERIVDFWKHIGQGDISEIQEHAKQYCNGKTYGSFSDIFLNLSILERMAIVASFMKSRLFALREIASYKDKMISDYGAQMYSIFHEVHQKKFWGIDPSKIDRKWSNTLAKPFFSTLTKQMMLHWFEHKGLITKAPATETHNFFHHKYGSGQMYTNLRNMAQNTGNARFHINSEVVQILHDGTQILSVEAKDAKGVVRTYPATDVISTIPLNVFVRLMHPRPPKEVLNAAKKLYFRNTVMVNLVIDGNPFREQWLQVLSNDIKAYRITNFCNLSKDMGNENLCPIAVEYNCFEGDAIWKMNDNKIIELAKKELVFAGIITKENALDASVLKVDHVYPIYFIGYEAFVSRITNYLSTFTNLQLISRGSIYRYNNMGHAVESGLVAADNLMGKIADVKELSTLDGKKDIYNNT